MGFKTANSLSSVSAPQFIARFPSHLIKGRGETLDLRCTVSGTPNPIITWKFNGQVIIGNNPYVSLLNGNRRLMVRILGKDDAGVYTCVARNQHGEVSMSSTVVVQANPIDVQPIITEQPRHTIVTEGQKTTISCISTIPSSHLYVFIWMKDGQMLKETSRCKYEREYIDSTTVEAKFTILHARPEDEGSYSVKINTCNFGALSRSVNLTVV